jgi:acetolactate synthase-1/3 small subunit
MSDLNGGSSARRNGGNGSTGIHTFSVLVENKPGVLARVSGLFARRGYNIESLVVSPTEDPTLSRMTICAGGDASVLDQITKQLNKLVDVVKIYDHTKDRVVGRELALIKVKADASSRAEIMQLCQIFRAQIVDFAEDTAVVEATGDTDKLDALANLLEKFGIVELMRTGKIVLVRGPAPT